jgi:signal transduction histidine kinase
MSQPQKTIKRIVSLAVAMIVVAMVGTGVFLGFAQFNPDVTSEYQLVHNNTSGFRYFAWDKKGNKREIEARYGQDGFLSDFSGTIQEMTGKITWVGFSGVLTKSIEGAILSISNAGSIPFIIFLDDEVFFTDFAGEGTASTLDRMPSIEVNFKPVFDRQSPRCIALTLPENYVGRTVTVVEYVADPIEYYYPMILSIVNSDTERVQYLASYGPNILTAGLCIGLLLLLSTLFVFRLFSDPVDALGLLLPIAFMFIHTVSKLAIPNFSVSFKVQDIKDFFVAFAYYCSCDLLLIFVGFKLSHWTKFILLGSSGVHLFFTTFQLLRLQLTGEDLWLYSHFLAYLGLFACVTALVLIIKQSRSSLSFLHGTIGVILYVIYFIVSTMVLKRVNYGLYVENISIFSSFRTLNLISQFNFFSVIMAIFAAVYASAESITDVMSKRIDRSKDSQLKSIKEVFFNGEQNEAYLKDPLMIAVSQILDLSRIEESRLVLKTKPCELAELIEHTLDTYYPKYSKNRNRLVFERSDLEQEVLCDKERIAIVLVSLINNASQNTRRGTITVRVLSEDDASIVEVEDNGKGMSPQQLSKIFTKLSFEENLGLYFCKHIIDEHGGDLQVLSEMGKGTTVRFSLPLASEVAYVF